MRKRYTATFYLGKEGEPGPPLADVSEVAIQWILRGGKTKLLSGAIPTPGESLARADLGNGAWLEAIAVETDGEQHWGMRFGHPDESDDRIEWHTEISTTKQPDGRTTFSCSNLVGAVGGFMAPARREASRPKVVPHVLRKWGGYHGFGLSHRARVLKSTDVDDFVDMLTSKDRTRPVVFLAAENGPDKPVIDAFRLADWLAGIAHVVVGADRFVSIWGLRDRLPKALSCWDGAVRVYWPGLRLSDNPFPHRNWRPRAVREIESDRRNGFREYLLGYVSQQAVFAGHQLAASWTTLEGLRRQQLITKARAEGNQDDLLTLADELIADQSKEIAQLNAHVEQLAADLHEKDALAETWRIAYQELRRTGAELAPEEQDELVPLDSVADVLERVGREFSEQVSLALNSKSDGAKSHFQNPQAIYAAFRFLAGTYFDARTGTKACDDFDQAIREEVEGWTYDPHQSKNTMKKYDSWYSTSWDGRKFYLPEHIGTGSGKNPHHTIRIAFTWDDTRNMVVVGFLGQHQKTDAT